MTLEINLSHNWICFSGYAGEYLCFNDPVFWLQAYIKD